MTKVPKLTEVFTIREDEERDLDAGEFEDLSDDDGDVGRAIADLTKIWAKTRHISPQEAGRDLSRGIGDQSLSLSVGPETMTFTDMQGSNGSLVWSKKLKKWREAPGQAAPHAGRFGR